MKLLIASIIGYLGTACLVLSFQCRKESRLFLCMLLSGFFFVVHYGLKGDWSGMAMDAVCMVRAGMMYTGRKSLSGKPAKYVLLGMIVLLTVLTWQDVFSLFPMIALLVSTWFIFAGKGDNIKKAQLFCTSPSWMVYNIYVRSWPGIICETLDMISVIVYFIRTRKDR